MSKWFTATAALIALYGAYLWAFPTAVVRFRLTANVEVDGKIHSGSSVYEIRFQRPMIPLGMPYESSFRGEAVAVDLGERGMLFVILDGPRGGEPDHVRMLPERVLVHRTKSIRWPADGDRVKVYSALSEEKWKVDLLPGEFPMLVRFRDLGDPATAERVDPQKMADAFGASAGLVGIRMERVDAGSWPLNLLGLDGEPVTRGIEGKLPWWQRSLPWVKPSGGGFVDSRPVVAREYRLQREHFIRGL